MAMSSEDITLHSSSLKKCFIEKERERKPGFSKVLMFSSVCFSSDVIWLLLPKLYYARDRTCFMQVALVHTCSLGSIHFTIEVKSAKVPKHSFCSLSSRKSLLIIRIMRLCDWLCGRSKMKGWRTLRTVLTMKICGPGAWEETNKKKKDKYIIISFLGIWANLTDSRLWMNKKKTVLIKLSPGSHH